MPVTLDATDIVNSFKRRLRSMTFIPRQDHADIKRQLDVLIDTRNRRKRVKPYSRLEKTEAAQALWEKLICASLANLTKNLRGYHELRQYFAQFIRYENLLFAVDRHHRDHVVHSIWVMLIGFYLIQKCRPLSPIAYSDLFLNRTGRPQDPSSMKSCESDIRKKEPLLWLLIALTHDLGYPIQKTKDANDLMSSMIDNFGFLEQQEFKYNFTVLQNTAIEELLNILSSSLVFTSDTRHNIVSFKGQRLGYAKSFERLDHGIMSAYLVLNYIDYICDSMNCPSDPTIPVPRRAALDQAIIIHWLSAIAAHTTKNVYWDTPKDLSALLILADELDEFSRYSHDPKSDKWVTIDCQTSFTCTKQSIRFQYRFPSAPEFDHLTFCKNKVAKLMNRFELDSRGIQLVSFTSTHLKPKKHQCHYQKRFPQLDGTLRINGKPEPDIHKWLAREEIS